MFNNIVDKRSDKNANEVVIGNKVYGGKYGNVPYSLILTDQTQGDGYKYRGKGLIHLTWKENYERTSTFAKNKNWVDTDDYSVNNPDSITTDGKFALLSAVYFWNNSMKNKSNNVNFKNKYCYEIVDAQVGTNEERVNAVTYVVNQETKSY